MVLIVVMSLEDNNPKLTELPSEPRDAFIWKYLNEPGMTFSLIFLVIVGGFIRLVHVINLSFPLNDGGFFYQLVIDLQKNNLILPEFSSYNASQIPNAYPPLGIYIAAIISNLFKWPIFDIVQLLPAFVSVFTIVAFIFLCKKLFSDKVKIIAAVFVFSFLPTSFDWLIVGGGLTRSFGYLFAILTLSQSIGLFVNGTKRSILFTILFASLTILSHPGTAWFTIYAALVILVFKRRENNRWVFKSLIVVSGILLLTSPWWLTIIIRHGFSVFTFPFQSESITLASILTPFTFLFTNEPLLPLLAFCGFLGVIVSLKNRFYFLPVWLFLTFIFESRLGATYSVIPMSLLAGIGIKDGLLGLVNNGSGECRGHGFSKISKLLISYLILHSMVAAFLSIDYQTVTSDEIIAMDWIQENTDASSRFLIITGSPEYGIDHINEWFPVLSHRSSVTVPQGHEWLPEREFTKRIELHKSLQYAVLDCNQALTICINTWSEEKSIDYSHIFVPESSIVIKLLLSEFENRIMYNGPGGIIILR